MIRDLLPWVISQIVAEVVESIICIATEPVFSFSGTPRWAANIRARSYRA
nr:hypothetical protein [Mycobacterium leprae]